MLSYGNHLRIYGFSIDKIETLVDGENYDAFLSVIRDAKDWPYGAQQRE
jgi:hypothetical protein